MESVKILIQIPKETYDNLTKYGSVNAGNTLFDTALNAIVNGKVLSKKVELTDVERDTIMLALADYLSHNEPTTQGSWTNPNRRVNIGTAAKLEAIVEAH